MPRVRTTPDGATVTTPISDQVNIFGVLPSSAHFSDDRRYRYALRRYWDMAKPPALFCGLNPSVANEIENDPTITREISFARDWGCGWMIKMNAYPFIATDPKVMKAAAKGGVDVAHREVNLRLLSEAIEEVSSLGGVIVPAWGANIDDAYQLELLHFFFDHVDRADHQLKNGARNIHRPIPMCFGVNNDGSPKHPLYLSQKTQLRPWRPEYVAKRGPL